MRLNSLRLFRSSLITSKSQYSSRCTQTFLPRKKPFYSSQFLCYSSNHQKKMGADQSTANLAMSECRIVVVGPRNGDESLVELANLPIEARIIGTGETLEELKQDGDLFAEGNVLLNVSGNSKTLPAIIDQMPFLVWIHSITAGVDHLLCPEILTNPEITLTNARGVFTYSLAEYVIGVCMHFAKNFPRMMEKQREHQWDKFKVTELKGKIMGVIGYGDIGRQCAKLGKAFNMKILGLRRHPELSEHDKLVDEIVGPDQLDYVFENSDYVVVSLALTPATRHFIKEENLRKAKKGLIFINIGRGALVDEEALTRCLQDGTVTGAALDVFTVEPLPEESPLWDLPNVLISPHNADYTKDSRQASVRYFTENCKKFLKGEELDCIVDKNSGY